MAGRQALIAEVLKSMKTDFENVKPDGYEEVVCPLCLRPFTHERGSKRRPSAEHIRPSSLGGTLEFPVSPAPSATMPTVGSLTPI